MHHQNGELRVGASDWNDEFVAQQVEHNTFNVGVPGSSPGEFTSRQTLSVGFFIFNTRYAIHYSGGKNDDIVVKFCIKWYNSSQMAFDFLKSAYFDVFLREQK